MSAAVAAARQLRRPMMQPVVLPQVRVGVPVSVPPVMGMLPVMPQFNLMRPLQPGQYSRVDGSTCIYRHHYQ